MTHQTLCLDTTPCKNEFGALKMVLSIIKDMLKVSRQRHALAGLTHDQLQDIGLTHAEAQVEAARPFWDLP